jgi:thiamine biosynthesis lipoprotein
MLQRAFRAMGTEVELLLDVGPSLEALSAFDDVEAEFHRLEKVFSRFDPDSELSRLNARGNAAASDDLRGVVRQALAARTRTGGLFDPTVHAALVGCGYDRSFELVGSSSQAPDGVPGCGGAVFLEGERIVLDPGVTLDLGGIAKGYAVDRACDLLAATGPCLVNAGGDLAVRGGAWPIAIEGGPTLELSSGAIATSGRDRRCWQQGGSPMHHLIDPRTSRPAETELLRVTVAAGCAAEAEVLAKAAFLGAPVGCPRALVFADGRTVLAGGLA